MSKLTESGKAQRDFFKKIGVFYDPQDHRMLAVLEAFKGENVGTVLDLGSYRCPIDQYLPYSPGLKVETADVIEGATHLFDFNNPFPLDDESFDSVFAGEIIEHVLNPHEFLAEIYRVLKPGGLLVITTPNLASIKNRLKLLLARQPTHTIHSYQHFFVFVPARFKKIVLDTGFVDFKNYGSGLMFTTPTFPMFLRRFGYHMGRRFPSIAITQTVKARKP